MKRNYVAEHENRIQERRLELGLTWPELSRRSGVAGASIYKNNLQKPTDRDGRWKGWAIAISIALESTPELIFPLDAACVLFSEESASPDDVFEAAIGQYSKNDFDICDRMFVQKLLAVCFESNPKEKRAIGVVVRNCVQGQSTEEIGKDLGVTSRRVRQITNRGLRIMRRCAAAHGMRWFD
ncbi:MAG: hypothetical protein JEY79_19480 [Pseudodesulfovibrio sp.]|nr:hypothetical protein [Pseudodesulfovibrio sp.]